MNLPEGVRLEAGLGRLPCLRLETGTMEAELYLHGAHITRYQPRGNQPVLWMSEHSYFEKDKPIRGGIPVCFPWFGNAGSPAHGFARLLEWKLDGVTRRGDAVDVSLRLHSDSRTLALWPQRFEALLTATFSTQLNVELAVTNIDNKPFRYETALHTYLAVGDVRQIEIAGLENALYFNKVSDERRSEAIPIRITEETDRLYNGTNAPCVLRDREWRRQIIVRKAGSNSTVVWNPWIAKAAAMPDFGEEEWPHMVCIETANVGPDAIELPPAETHRIRAEIQAPVV